MLFVVLLSTFNNIHGGFKALPFKQNSFKSLAKMIYLKNSNELIYESDAIVLVLR